MVTLTLSAIESRKGFVMVVNSVACRRETGLEIDSISELERNVLKNVGEISARRELIASRLNAEVTA